MHIERLSSTEEETAVALWREAGLLVPWNDPLTDLRRALGGPSSTVLAGHNAEGALIATVMVGHDGHRGWVYYLAVASRARGQGHGRALMASAEAWLIEREVPKLNLMVRATNEAVIGFYEALGYAREERAVFARRLDQTQ